MTDLPEDNSARKPLTARQRHALAEAMRYIDMMADEGDDPGAGTGEGSLFATDVVSLIETAFGFEWSGPLDFHKAFARAIGA